jgi:hypothetical protein
MTTIVTDERISQDMKDAISSAISRMGGIQAASDILNDSSAQTLVVTDRLPISASVLDHATGLRTLITDPAAIAAMLPGEYAFVGSASNGPDGTRDIVFDWSDIDLGGASADGQPVLYVGSAIVDAPDHAYQVLGAYDIMTDMTLERVLTHGVARAFADASGTFQDGAIDGVDHGVGFASIVDGMAFAHGMYDPNHSYVELVGPGSYAGGGFSYGSFNPIVMNGEGLTSSFGVDAAGSIVIDVVSDGTTFGESLLRTTLMKSGTEVLGISYENYSTQEFIGSTPIMFDNYGELTMSYDAQAAQIPMHGVQMVQPIGVLMRRLDTSFVEMANAGPDDGSTALLSQGLGLSGFSSHAFGQTRILSASNIREINMSSTGVAYGVQVDDGDIRYDTTGLAAAGTDQDPTAIALDDRGSTIDTLLIGNGRLENVIAGGPTQFGNNTSETHDNRFSTNLIQAGEGDDIIITVRPETWPAGLVDVIHGNGGDDLIMLNTIDAEAFGGDGNDTIAIGMGDQVVHGGDGYDTIAFEGNIYTYFGVNFDARTGLGTFVSDGFPHTTQADGFERVLGTTADDVLIGVDGMTIDGQGGFDDITLGNMGIGIGGADDDVYRLEVAQSGTARYLLMGVDAGDRLFLDGVQHFGSQASVGADGVDWRSGEGDNVWNTDRPADADPMGDFWTETLFNGTEGTWQGESLSKILIEHHVGGAVVASTEIFMTGFTSGDAGLTFDKVTATDLGGGAFDYAVASSGTSAYDLHMTQTAQDVLTVFQPSAAPAVTDMFGLV